MAKKAIITKLHNTPDEIAKSRQVFAIMQIMKGKKLSEIADLVESKSEGEKVKRVSLNTIRNWYIPAAKGGTRFPSSRTLDAVASALGYEFKLTKTKRGG